MKLEEFKAHCLSKNGVEDSYPMRGECVWMKVAGKMFALTNVRDFKMNGEMVAPFHFINLKCDPEKAVALRARHPAIQPGWHQNKTHWNSLLMDGSLDDRLVADLTDHAYDIVAAALPKKVREQLDG
ncbi:MAG: MmcQ/YjbR family DNA-binding protein [Alphaproteobacteria bacterium]|nr:MmcQ/YjbR family DNA-binding protein [Alphaproteobacteria bacterium]